MFTRIGANDPDFNLRRDAGFMIRRNNVADTIFVSVIEPHGSYNPVSELAVNSKSSIAALRVLHNDDDYTVVSIEDVHGQQSVFALAKNDASKSAQHRLKIGGKRLEWQGPHYYLSDY
jgi:hypothetical protein